MRYTLLFLMLVSGLVALQAQEVNFRLIYVDTFPGEQPGHDLAIKNSTVFREVFYGSKYAIDAPRFQHTIYLKRTIQSTCLQGIDHIVTIDSVAKTLTWRSIIKKGPCEEVGSRQIVIAVARPPSDYTVQFDTTWLNQEHHTPVPIAELPLNGVSCQLDHSAGGFFYPIPAVITTDSLYLRYKLGEALNCTSRIDFSSTLILANNYGGDCLMRLIPHAYFDPITNTLILEVHNIWGGCRAGGRESLAVVVPKPPTEDFQVVFQEIQIDSWEEYNEQFLRKN